MSRFSYLPKAWWAAMAAVIAMLAGVSVIAALGKPASEAAAVRQTLTAAIVSDKPADCTRFFTQRFLDQVEGEVGAEAVEECRHDAPDPPHTEGADVSRVSVAPTSASAIAKVRGGDFDGSVLSVELVRESDRWKLDQLLDVRIDRARFDAVVRADEIRYGATRLEGDCWVRRFDTNVETPDVERALLRGETSEMMAVGYSCFGAATLHRLIGRGLREGISQSGAPPELGECIAQHVLEGLTVQQLRRFLRKADTDPYLERMRRTGVLCQKLLNMGGPSSS